MRWILLGLGLTGCKVVDAPDTLEELVVFGFETFGSEAEMQATLDNLVPLVEQNQEDLIDGYRVGSLTVDQLASAGIESAETEGISGAMGLVPYRNALDAVVPVIIDEDKEDHIESLLEFVTDDRSDKACFLGHSCDRFEQYVEERVQVAILGESFRKYTHTLQWLEHEEYGTVLAIRSLSPDPIEFSTNFAKVYQQYGMTWILPDAEGARRIEVFWIDAEIIGLSVPDSYAVDSAVSAMRRTAETIDDIIEGVE